MPKEHSKPKEKKCSLHEDYSCRCGECIDTKIYNEQHHQWTAYTAELMKPLEKVYEKYKNNTAMYEQELNEQHLIFWNAIQQTVKKWINDE